MGKADSIVDAGAKVLTTKQQLDAMEKVTVRIPLPTDITKEEAIKMKHPPYVPVGINGYTYQIRRGEDVAVPVAVAAILRDAGFI